MNESKRTAPCYRIRIREHLDPSWASWFDGLSIIQAADQTTTMTGPIIDQAALYGVLSRLRDLGATLLSVERLTTSGLDEGESPLQ